MTAQLDEQFPRTDPAHTIPASAGLQRLVAVALEFYLPRIHDGIIAYASHAGWWGGVNQLFLPIQMSRLAECWSGVIALPWISLFTALESCRCPVVEVFGVANPARPCAVCVDWKGLGQIGARHLLERGYQRLVFYRRSLQPEARSIQQGFEEVVREAGLAPELFDRPTEQKEVEDLQSTRLTRLPWLKERIAACPRPMAIMAEDDRFALDVVAACQLLGLRIPEDVAVLGTDNDPRAINLSPVPLSSLDSNQFEVGYRAAELLDRLMRGEPPPTAPLVVPPGPVVVRDSTDTYVRGSAGTKAAYSYMRRNFSSKITPEKIAAHVGVASRTLQLHFKRDTGRTLSQEITRLRLDHACQLLTQTDLKISSIAHETGFNSYAHFCALFGSHFHRTPSEYRDAFRKPAAA